MEYGVVFRWWLLYAGLATAGLPIAAVVFSRLRDRGAAFALPVALVVLFTSVYWIGRFTFGVLGVALSVLVLLAVSAYVYVRFDPEIAYRRFGEWLAVFTAAFLLVVAIRAVYPAIQPIGGEKFLDFGLLKTILRDTSLPPEDMWFAGEGVQYYYGGHLLSAALTILSGTAPRYAYNVALAGFFGTLVATAYGLAGSIAASRGSSYRRGGLFGAFFVGIAGNLVATLQVVLMPIPGGLKSFIAKRFANGALEVVELTAPFSRESGRFYWIPSRGIEGTITEFPLFAWLNGDLHAHMMSTPFLLLLAGVVFAYYLTPEEEIRRRRLLVFGAAPPIAGMLAVVNTWSFPSTAGVAFLGILFADSDPLTLFSGTTRREASPERVADGGDGERLPDGGEGGIATRIGRGFRAFVADLDRTGWGAELTRMGAAFLAGVGVLVVGAIWAFPFLIGPAIGAPGRRILPVPDGSGWSGVLLVHGWALAVFAVYFVSRTVDSFRPTRHLLILGALLVIAILDDLAAIALVFPLLALGWIGLRRGRDLGFESVLFIAGAGLVLLVELIFLSEGGSGGRLNTVFKSYMQVWVLWGTAVGAALAIVTPDRPVAAAVDGAIAAFTPGNVPFDSDQLRTLTAAALSVMLVVSLSSYGMLALGLHFGDNHFAGAPPEPALGGAVSDPGGFADNTTAYLDYVFNDPSLDGTAWLDRLSPTTDRGSEWQAIQWLDERPGKPNIVTAAPGGYRWRPGTGGGASAPSSLTGIPTVLGWFHEEQYRGNGPYQQRLNDVETIYQGTIENRSKLLRKYDVEYVYAGPAERAEYGGGNVTVFRTMPGVSLAQSWGADMRIYRVDQSALPGARTNESS